MRSLRPNQLHGSFAPLITPFSDGAVDYDTFIELVDWHAAQGSHGVVVGADSIGEPTTLTSGERRTLTATAVEVAACRMEVLVDTASERPRDTLELTEHAATAGADAIIVAVPQHVPHRGAVVAHLADLARRPDLPVLVHISETDSSLDLLALSELTSLAPNVVGVQLSTFDLAFVTEALMTFGSEFRILADVDEMTYFMLAAGAHGCVHPIANVVPGWVAEMYYAVAKDGFVEGRAAHRRLYELTRALGAAMRPLAVKQMMSRLGLLPSAELGPIRHSIP